MDNFYLIAIMLMGLLLYKWKKGLLICYWYILNTLCLPLITIACGAITDEEILIAYGRQNAMLNILFCVIFVCEVIRKRFFLFDYLKYALPILLIGIYTLFWCLFNNANFDLFISNKSFVYKTIIIVFLFASSNTTANQIKYTFLFVLIVELIVALLNNYLDIRLYISHYFLESKQLFANEFVSGTFKRFSDLAGFLSCLFVVLCCEYFVKNRISTKNFFPLIVMTSYVILLTGSRSALLISISSFIIFPIKDFKRHKKFVLLITILLFYLFSLVLHATLNNSEITTESNGIERNIIGLSNKFSKKNKQETTDDMSGDLLSKYGISLFGQAKTVHKSVESAYGDENYAVDSRLAFFIVEYGIVYLFLSLFWFYNSSYLSMRHLTKNDKQNINILFLLMLMLAITDDGLYSNVIFFSIIIYIYYNNKLLYEQNEGI